MYPRLMLVTALLLVCGVALAGQTPVYRWVKPDGTVVYSDTPSSPHARQVHIDEPDSAASPATRAAGKTGSKDHADADAGAGKAADGAAGSSLCDQWRKRVALIRNHDQLYMKKKGGGRVKLTPKQRRQRLQQAQAQVKQNCAGETAGKAASGGGSGS